MVANVALGLFVLSIGVAICIVTRSPVGLAAIIPGSLQAGFTGLLTRRTRKGQELLEAWKAFKARIKRAVKQKKAVSLTSAQWQDHLVAAVALGLHKPLIRLLEDSGSGAGTIPFFAGDASGLAHGLNGLIGSVSSTVSTGAGVGGGAGASSGGGGGAG